MTAKKKAKAKIHKVLVVKVQKLDEDKHIVAAEYEVHGPADALPEFVAEPLEITPEAVKEKKVPESHWYDFLTKW